MGKDQKNQRYKTTKWKDHKMKKDMKRTKAQELISRMCSSKWGKVPLRFAVLAANYIQNGLDFKGSSKDDIIWTFIKHLDKKHTPIPWRGKNKINTTMIEEWCNVMDSIQTRYHTAEYQSSKEIFALKDFRIKELK